MQHPHSLPWMETLYGHYFYPSDPSANVYDIRDIAGALSKQCRYGGHCTKFYSVAEHCVHIAYNAPREVALEGLMHDASEAYLVDVPRAVKRFLSDYKPLERQIETEIARKFGLLYNPDADGWAWPEAIQKLDERILHNEKAQLMAASTKDWSIPHEPIADLRLPCWSPEIANARFLEAFHYFNDMRNGGANV